MVSQQSDKLFLMRKRALTSRCRFSGNALMEYVVPAVALFLASGLILTFADISGLMGSSYILATGHPLTSLSGNALKSSGLNEGAFGDIENGSMGVYYFGSLDSGGGNASGYFWTGPVTRIGSRASSGDPDYLFPPT